VKKARVPGQGTDAVSSSSAFGVGKNEEEIRKSFDM
jgi:hypothetical protein